MMDSRQKLEQCIHFFRSSAKIPLLKKKKKDYRQVGHQRVRWYQNYCRKIEWKWNQTQVDCACLRAPRRGAARERIHQINSCSNSTGGLLMRSPVFLSPVQPCPTRTKHAASYIPPRARGEGQCGGKEEVWKDGGEKGRRQVYNWQGKWKAHKKKGFALTLFSLLRENVKFVVQKHLTLVWRGTKGVRTLHPARQGSWIAQISILGHIEGVCSEDSTGFLDLIRFLLFMMKMGSKCCKPQKEMEKK